MQIKNANKYRKVDRRDSFPENVPRVPRDRNRYFGRLRDERRKIREGFIRDAVSRSTRIFSEEIRSERGEVEIIREHDIEEQEHAEIDICGRGEEEDGVRARDGGV